MNVESGLVSAAAAARRVERERRARQQAEEILESKSRQLYEANQALIKQARADPLTGLLNRHAFVEEVRQKLANQPAARRLFALAFMDINRFGRLNESYGQMIADKALLEIAHRLQGAIPGAALARWSGDQFAMLLQLDFADNPDTALRPAMEVFGTEFRVEGRPVALTCSVGIALAPIQANSVDDLVTLTKTALASAKQIGKGACVTFNNDLRAALDQRGQMEIDLRAAVESNSVAAWFQPIVEIDRLRVASLEILARWQPVGQGFVPPSTFIPLAGELGLLGELDRQVARAAFKDSLYWIKSHAIDTVSLNVSPRYVNDGGLVSRVMDLIEATGLPPTGLTLELTEDAVFEDYSQARRHLGELTARGIRVALDDFGCGYSNIKALADLPLSTIKLDRSLVAPIVTDMNARTLLGAVVHLAKTLRLTVVAEGVENENQALVLRVLGVDRLQGYLYGRAMPASEVCNRLNDLPPGAGRDFASSSSKASAAA